ncbi:MAG: hypothetical protein E7313_03580 [Clostridiales bacterium]|nr:hypothetical protein [Clostridiales bacterium]
MNKATAKNEIQVVLEEYMGNRKAAKVAEAVYAVVQTETQHTHFIKEDSNGALVLTMESMVKEHVETILTQYLEKDEVQECLEQLMVGSISTEKEMTTEIETISVEGSDSQIYSELLEYTPTDSAGESFLENLREAVDTGVNPFKVPIYDPSISKNGSLQFVAGCKPAVGYSFDELKELASKNGVQLGSKNQYILFLATIIHRLVEEGWTKDAIYAVCTDSTEVGHYYNSKKAKHDFEVTGSRKIAGKCDLGNTYKILAKDEKAGGFWLAGGCYGTYGYCCPLASLNLCNCYDIYYDNGVGWFVL